MSREKTMQFYSLVKQMRESQKAYFDCKANDDEKHSLLQRSKVLENQVDTIIKRTEEKLINQIYGNDRGSKTTQEAT